MRTMKEARIIINQNIVRFTVEDIRFERSEYGIHCVGFGSLVIGNFRFSSMIDMEETLPEVWLVKVMEELHALAFEAAQEQEEYEEARREGYQAWRNS